MVFKWCRKCLGIRQFLPNGYPEDGEKRCCDICGAEE